MEFECEDCQFVDGNGNIDFKLSEALLIANYFGKSIEEIFLGQKLI